MRITCVDCNTTKAASKFLTDARCSNGHSKRCNTCRELLGARYTARQVYAERTEHTAVVDTLWNAQGGACDICHESAHNRHGLTMNYDYANGNLRALLCFPCNSIVVASRDDAGRTRMVADWLDQNV